MEKLKMHSSNLVEQNIEKLADLFPNCVTESKGVDGKLQQAIDFDLLKQELSRNIVEGPQERYQLNWPGKREALLNANAPIAKTLRPCSEDSVNFDTTQNLFIEGDNLDALKLLQETYIGKIKLIFIDPPYNTGSDFVYRDNFAADTNSYLKTSLQVDDDKNRLIVNTDSSGRFHSEWLSMIYSRLKVARNLLSDDGAIFVAIDDCEVGNLRKVMDEIFGEKNLISNFVWQSKDTPGNDSSGIAQTHNHILAYSKTASFVPNMLERSDKQIATYKNPDNDHRGPWLGTPLTRSEYRERDFYPLNNPCGEKVYPPSGSCWRRPKPVIEQLMKENRVWWGKNGDAQFPMEKKFLSETKAGVVNQSWWPYEFAGSTRNASAEIKDIFDGGKPFDTPKPTKLIRRIIDMCTDSESIVLDFFAGSGTTAHALMQANKDDGGKRRFILVQAAEPCSEKSQAIKDGFLTVADICKKRIFLAGAKISDQAGHHDLDNGFRTFFVDNSCMSDIYYSPEAVIQNDLFSQVENIKVDRTDEDLLFQVMLDWGVDLSLPIQRETLDGKTVFFVDAQSDKTQGALVACFDKTGGINDNFIKQLATFTPLRLVFRDAGFSSDATKINVEQLLKQLSPATDVKTI